MWTMAVALCSCMTMANAQELTIANEVTLTFVHKFFLDLFAINKKYATKTVAIIVKKNVKLKYKFKFFTLFETS